MAVIVISSSIAVAVGLAMLFFKKSSRPATPPPRAKSSPRVAPPGDPHAMHWLIGIGGEVEGKSYLIGTRMVTIGRTPNNAIQITEAGASRTHCQLRVIGDRLQVIDMNSRNSTLVNGTPCQTARMAPGDELRIGTSRFIYQLHADLRQDASLGGKATGQALLRATAAAATQSSNLERLVRGTLEETAGDVDAAAKKLRITPEALRAILAEIEPRVQDAQ